MVAGRLACPSVDVTTLFTVPTMALAPAAVMNPAATTGVTGADAPDPDPAHPITTVANRLSFPLQVQSGAHEF